MEPSGFNVGNDLDANVGLMAAPNASKGLMAAPNAPNGLMAAPNAPNGLMAAPNAPVPVPMNIPMPPVLPNAAMPPPQMASQMPPQMPGGFPFAPMVIPPPVGGDDGQMVGANVPQPPPVD